MANDALNVRVREKQTYKQANMKREREQKGVYFNTPRLINNKNLVGKS